MSGWLLNTVSFSSPLIARLDTLWRQWTNLFIKSGVWLPPLRATLSSWYHSCGDKEQGTGDRHLYIRRQWSIWASPGTKEKPPPPHLWSQRYPALLCCGVRVDSTAFPRLCCSVLDRSQCPSLYLRSWKVFFPVVNSFGSLGGIQLRGSSW